MQISKAQILVVGAGGIGCELLKNLVLSGFSRMTVVDLDTIDLSNLNRQFLFRNKHIKMSKALVASEAVKQLTNNQVEIEAIHANIITDPRFDVKFYSQFDFVINALDNLEARRHVNKMCVINELPLIESGTAGLLGQATLHLPRIGACFDCRGQSSNEGAQKTYAICTIRSTPSTPIHCIVWAKSYLFSILFGDGDGLEASSEDNGENAEELQTLNKEAQELEHLKSLLKDQSNLSNYSDQVFSKIYQTDVERVASIDEMWAKQGRTRPIPLDSVKHLAPNMTIKDHAVWSFEENYHMFMTTCRQLAQRYIEGGLQPLDFDKDDDVAMQFVTAASNLRSIVYNIKPLKSLFDAKQMAGNIIAAIASTNAIIAGQQLLLALKLVKNLPDNRSQDKKKHWQQLMQKARKSYLSYEGRHWIQSEPLELPNPQCEVCNIQQMTFRILKVSSSYKLLLSHLLDHVTKDLGFEGDLSITRSSDSALLYDVDFDDNLDRDVKQFMIQEQKQLALTISDDDSLFVPLALYVLFDASVKKVDKLRSTGDLVQKKIVIQSKRRLNDTADEDDFNKKFKVVEIDDGDEDIVVIVQ